MPAANFISPKPGHQWPEGGLERRWGWWEERQSPNRRTQLLDRLGTPIPLLRKEETLPREMGGELGEHRKGRRPPHPPQVRDNLEIPDSSSALLLVLFSR